MPGIAPHRMTAEHTSTRTRLAIRRPMLHAFRAVTKIETLAYQRAKKKL